MCLLLVPMFAMQFGVEGVDWDVTDFIVASGLLAALGVAVGAATNSNFTLKRRAIGIGGTLLVIALYVHLAFGIVDTWPLAGS
jgi:hypothetical protein